MYTYLTIGPFLEAWDPMETSSLSQILIGISRRIGDLRQRGWSNHEFNYITFTIIYQLLPRKNKGFNKRC